MTCIKVRASVSFLDLLAQAIIKVEIDSKLFNRKLVEESSTVSFDGFGRVFDKRSYRSHRSYRSYRTGGDVPAFSFLSQRSGGGYPNGQRLTVKEIDQSTSNL